MDITQTFYAPDRQTWRAWLEQHHLSSPEIWLVFYKKHTGKPSVSLAEAVEEALCFGWIDSLLKRLDNERHALRFTPRRPNSRWSDLNRRRVAKLIIEGRMTPAGLEVIPAWVLEEPPPPTGAKKAPEMPAFVREALAANPPALDNFERLPPSQREMYLAWIADAKKDETRLRRLAQAVEKLKLDERMGMV
jgi:uncharacterized protein YdeI (YjbR/CyaY-like superfamily)